MAKINEAGPGATAVLTTRLMPDTGSNDNGPRGKVQWDIPDYATATGEVLAQMDARIASIDFVTPQMEQALSFGQSSLAVWSTLSEELNVKMRAESGAFGQMKDAVTALQAIDTESMVDHAEMLLNKGAQVVKQGGKFIMAHKAGFVTGGVALATGFGAPLALLMGAGTGLVVKTAEAVKSCGLKGLFGKKANGGDLHQLTDAEKDQLVIDIETSAHEGVLNIKKARRELANAAAKIPAELRDIEQMARANAQVFSDTALDIGAGREILRRVRDEVIPAIENDDTLGPLEVQMRTREWNEWAAIFDKTLLHLEICRNEALNDTATVLTDMRDTLLQTKETIESNLGRQVASQDKSLTLALKAVRIYKQSSLVAQFDKSVEQAQKNALIMTELAQQAAEAARFDSPEKLNALALRMEEARIRIENKETLRNDAALHIEDARQRMQAASVDLVNAVVSGRGHPALPPARAAAALHNG